jgi:hypothetical protein
MVSEARERTTPVRLIRIASFTLFIVLTHLIHSSAGAQAITSAKARIGTSRYLAARVVFRNSANEIVTVPLGSRLKLLGVLDTNRLAVMPITYMYEYTHGAVDTVWTLGDEVIHILGDFEFKPQAWAFVESDPVSLYNVAGETLVAYRDGKFVKGMSETAFVQMLKSPLTSSITKIESSDGNSYRFVYHIDRFSYDYTVITTGGLITFWSRTKRD